MCLLIAILAYFLIILFRATLFYPMPVNDSGITRYRAIPWVTLTLIVLNTVIFVLWIAPDLYARVEGNVVVEPAIENYIGKVQTYGYTEKNIREGIGVGALASFSSMFMHAHFWHLFGNMMYLWTFGRRVEDACGSWRFLLFYLLSGMVAHFGSVILDPLLGTRPSIGASGAIAGVMGAYLLLFPGTTVNCLWGIGVIARLPIATLRLLSDRESKFWRWTVSLPAWTLLGWFVLQSVLPSIETIQGDEELVGVNHLAHLTGFFAALTVFLFVRKDLMMRYLQGRTL